MGFWICGPCNAAWTYGLGVLSEMEAVHRARTAPAHNNISDPRDHMNLSISHPSSKAQSKGDTKNHGCRILMFMWSFAALNMGCYRVLVNWF